MSVATAIARSGISVTNQTIADLMLNLHQERKTLEQRIAEIDSEMDRLAALVQ